MHQLFSCRTIFDDLRIAANRLDGQLPYLFATGSSESSMRDALAYQLHTKYLNVAREYRIQCNGQKRRADIAVLGDTGREPQIILELKQLYLKDFYLSDMRQVSRGILEDLRHKYVCNIVNDVTDRRTACSQVYGVVFTRRIPFGAALPCTNTYAHSYVKEDEPFVSRGIESMHRMLARLACIADCFPATWQEAKLLRSDEAGASMELYAWVVRAA